MKKKVFVSGCYDLLHSGHVVEVRERCGLSTSTRNVIKKIWPLELPNMEPETLAHLVFCYENHPERNDGIISGAQDAIGICVPGLCRHYYDKRYWPYRIETCEDESILPYTSLAHKAEGKKPVKKNGGGNSIKEFIDKYSALPDVLAWKMPGAGGGGYLACVVEDAEAFCAAHGEAFRLTIRRAGM